MNQNETKELMGVTFSGCDVKIERMFDIHDNQHVEVKMVMPEKEQKEQSQGKSVAAQTLPADLNTDEAKALLQRFIDADWLDEGYQPIGLKLTEQALLASAISEKLWNENRWKPFEQLWDCNGLAQKHNRALNQKNSYSTIADITKIIKQ